MTASVDTDDDATRQLARVTSMRTEPATRRPVSAARRLSQTTDEDRIVVWGSWIGALALAWMIDCRLLPWTGAISFILTWFVAGLLLLALATWLTAGTTTVVERTVSAVVHGGAFLVAVALMSTIGYIVARGWSALHLPNLLTQDMSGVTPRDPVSKGGVLHAIVGSLIEVGIAISVVIPLGIGTAVFMTEVGGRFAKVVRTVVEAMTALPSIVAGLFIYTTLLLGLGLPKSGLAAAAAIGVMMLPIVARASDVVLRVVPSGLREASLALGASRWRTVWNVVLPTARPSLVTATILGVARGVGETSPVLLTSGATTFLVTNPTSGPMNSLPLFIYSTVRSGEPILIARAFAAATVLLALVLLLFTTARLLARPRKGSR